MKHRSIRNRAVTQAAFVTWLCAYGAGVTHAAGVDPFTLSIGSGQTTLLGVRTDTAHNVIVVGTTDSADAPLVAPFKAANGGSCDAHACRDGFIVKLRADLSPIFTTYFGGNGDDTIVSVDTDPAGAIYFAVESSSTDYPGAPDASCSSAAPCHFITKLSADGQSVVYSRKVGGVGADIGRLLAVAAGGFVYYTEGRTFSSPFLPFCLSTSVMQLTPAGEIGLSGGAVASVGDCEGLFNIFEVVAAEDDGVFVRSAEFVNDVVRRARADGTVVFEKSQALHAPLSDLITASDDRVLIISGSDRERPFVFTPVASNGALGQSFVLAPPEEWFSSLIPATRAFEAGVLHTVICRDQRPLPLSECRHLGVTEQGELTFSRPLPTVDGATAVSFAIGRGGTLVRAALVPGAIVLHRFGTATLTSTSSLPNTVAVGTSLTWRAQASPLAGAEYQFWRYDPNTGWSIAQPWSTNAAYTWTPGYADTGGHALQVWVRSPGSPAAYDDWAAAEISVTGPPLPVVTSLSSSSPSPYFAGSGAVAWTAQASGGIGTPQYQFWRFDTDGWHVAQPYSASNTYAWSPTAADAGEHALQVWVRNPDSPAQYEAWQGLTFTVTPPASLNVTTLAAGTTPTIGATTTWAAVTSGGRAPLQYKFWRLDPDAWHMVQDYGASNTYSWTPGVNDGGSHALQVWVRNQGSTSAFDAWLGTGLFNVPLLPPVNVTFSAAPALPARTGTPLTWTAAANTSGVEYQVWRFDQGTGWQIVQPWGPSATYTWTPLAGDTGTHALQVWVRRRGSSASYDGWAGTGFFSISP